MKKNILKRLTAFAAAMTMIGISFPSGGVLNGLPYIFGTAAAADDTGDIRNANDGYVEIDSWDELKTCVFNSVPSETTKIRLTGNVHLEDLGINSGLPGDSITVKRDTNIEIDLNKWSIYRESIDGVNEGSIIVVEEGASLTITDTISTHFGEIRGGLSENGGGIINYGTLSITNAAITGNAAVAAEDSDEYGGCGGGIANYGKLYLYNVKIHDNHAIGYDLDENNRNEGNGGGIANYGEMYIYPGTVLSGNSATDNGGGIYNAAGSVCEISSTLITENRAKNFGGGICSYSSGTITDTQITENVSGCGGGLYHGGDKPLHLKGTTSVESNAARKAGGVYQDYLIYVYDSIKVRGNKGSDYYLSGTQQIHTQRLNNDAIIFVTAEHTPRRITWGFKENNPDIASDYEKYSKIFAGNHAFRIDCLLENVTEEKGEIVLDPMTDVLFVDRFWDNDAALAVDHIIYAQSDYIRNISDAAATNKLEGGYYYVLDKDTTFDERLVIDGTVNIILTKDHDLRCNKGIHVGENSTLNIYGRFADDDDLGSGKLRAEVDNSDNAAIGGDKWEKAGQINIYSGNITAVSTGGYGAAIGGGLGMSRDNKWKTGSPRGIAIYGGTVDAYENNSSPAIGGGRYGISSWENGIKIYGGKVLAQGHVGIGDSADLYDPDTPPIEIYGGEVNAQGQGGAGIGSLECNNCRINIHGGFVKAVSKGASRCAAGIGSGRDHDQSGDINITGGIVLASSFSGAGIGAGIEGNAGNINITGGVVDSRSLGGGAGIGGGKYGNGGVVTVEGETTTVFAISCKYDDSWQTTHKWAGYGNVTPTAPYGVNVGGKAFTVLVAFIYDLARDSEYSGAGIGGGFEGDGNTVNINGGRVVASASDEEACAIGYGDDGTSSGNVKVYDNAKVSAGNDKDSAAPKAKEKRNSSCKENRYVCVEPCDHSSCKGVYINSRYHDVKCEYCGKCVRTEEHTFLTGETPQYSECSVCGGTATESSLKLIQKNPDGSEKTDIIKLPKNYVYTIPECTSAPEGYEFIYWIERNDVYLPGDTINVNYNTLTAVYLHTVPTQYIGKDGKPAEVSARQLTNDVICLPEGIYVADSDLTMNTYNGLVIKGNVKLILADGKTVDIPEHNDRHISVTYDNTNRGTLSIYGQEQQTGKLSVDGTAELTGYHQYGGKVEQTWSGVVINGECQIERGSFSTATLYVKEPVVINGGNVHIEEYRLNNVSSIRLRWTKITDSIQIDRFSQGTGTTPDISVADQKVFKDDSGRKYSGTLSAEDLSAMLGKLLTPYHEDVEIAGYALGLNDSISIKIYYAVYDPDILANGQVGISSPGRAEEKYPFSAKEEVDGNEYYVFTYNVAAKEMKDTVTIQLYKDGEPVGEPVNTSVRTIADIYLSDPKYIRTVPLVNAMLHYGEYSQKYFDYNCDGLDYTDISDTVIDEEYAPDRQPAPSLPTGTSFAGATLTFRSETTLSFYFRTDDKTLSYSLDSEAEKKGYASEIDMSSFEGYTIFRVRGIKPDDLGESITVYINGSYGVTYSPLNYCYIALNGGTTDEDLRNVCRALYLYYIEAYKYEASFKET